jgi:hypothetical protein
LQHPIARLDRWMSGPLDEVFSKHTVRPRGGQGSRALATADEPAR